MLSPSSPNVENLRVHEEESGWEDKGAEWPLTSHTHRHTTLTHTGTQTEGNHSTPPSVYIRDVLHTQMIIICKIFSSEVMVGAADSQSVEFLLVVCPEHLMLFHPLPVLSYIQILGPSSAWCSLRRPRTEETLNSDVSSWGMNLSHYLWKAGIK